MLQGCVPTGMSLQLAQLSRALPDPNTFPPFLLCTAAFGVPGSCVGLRKTCQPCLLTPEKLQKRMSPRSDTSHHSGWDGKLPPPAVPVTHTECRCQCPSLGSLPGMEGIVPEDRLDRLDRTETPIARGAEEVHRTDGHWCHSQRLGTVPKTWRLQRSQWCLPGSGCSCHVLSTHS